MRQFSTPNADDQATTLTLGDTFTTYWLIVADEQEAAWSGVAIGERAPVEVGHPANALAEFDADTLARYCITEQDVADPPAPVPSEISNLQARMLLTNLGQLAAVNAAVAGAGGEMAIYWEYAATFHRDHPSLEIMRVGLGWTNEQLDTMFVEAAKIT